MELFKDSGNTWRFKPRGGGEIINSRKEVNKEGNIYILLNSLIQNI